VGEQVFRFRISGKVGTLFSHIPQSEFHKTRWIQNTVRVSYREFKSPVPVAVGRAWESVGYCDQNYMWRREYWYSWETTLGYPMVHIKIVGTGNPTPEVGRYKGTSARLGMVNPIQYPSDAQCHPLSLSPFLTFHLRRLDGRVGRTG